jgi:hypothetical protein
MKEIVNDCENLESGWSDVAVVIPGIASPFPKVACPFADRGQKEVAWMGRSLVETG